SPRAPGPGLRRGRWRGGGARRPVAPGRRVARGIPLRLHRVDHHRRGGLRPDPRTGYSVSGLKPGSRHVRFRPRSDGRGRDRGGRRQVAIAGATWFAPIGLVAGARADPVSVGGDAFILSVLTSLSRSIDRVNTLVGRAVSWLLLAMVLAQFGIVVMRYVFGAGSLAM